MEVYGLLAAGYGDWPIIKQISWLLGQVMNGIYNVMSGLFGIENIGICIIIFTIIVYSFMIPLTIKQQKFSKMSAVMQPEIRKIQKKYEGKKDQASMLKQQEEMKLVYEKYGTSMSGGCLPLLIQMPVRISVRTVSGRTEYSEICKRCERSIHACSRTDHGYRWFPEDHGDDRVREPRSDECKFIRLFSGGYTRKCSL